MLTQLLALLDGGYTFSIGDLAQRLGIGEDAVKAQMEYLERLGMLRRLRRLLRPLWGQLCHYAAGPRSVGAGFVDDCICWRHARIPAFSH